MGTPMTLMFSLFKGGHLDGRSDRSVAGDSQTDRRPIPGITAFYFVTTFI